MTIIKRIVLLVATFGVCAQVAGAQMPAQNLPAGQSFITSSGQGMVTASPDLAYVNTNITTNDPDPAIAISANGTAYQSLRDRMQAQGIASSDLQQTSYNVQDLRPPARGSAPAYPGQRYGYTVSRGIRITVRDVSRAQTIAETVAGSGASGFTSVRYSLTDENQRLQQQTALASAVAQARQEATAAARAAGLHIVRLHILQVGQNYPMPMTVNAAPAMANAGLMQIGTATSISAPPAQVQVRASVTATYLVSSGH